MNFSLHNYRSAADRLQIAEQTLRNWVHQGRISHYKIGAKVFFSDEQIENFIQANVVPAGGHR